MSQPRDHYIQELRQQLAKVTEERVRLKIERDDLRQQLDEALRWIKESTWIEAWTAQLNHMAIENSSLTKQLAQVNKDYYELIMAVGKKYRDETRHQTALRYIQRAEEPRGDAVTAQTVKQ